MVDFAGWVGSGVRDKGDEKIILSPYPLIPLQSFPYLFGNLAEILPFVIHSGKVCLVLV
jgi:hypothetical protein